MTSQSRPYSFGLKRLLLMISYTILVRKIVGLSFSRLFINFYFGATKIFSLKMFLQRLSLRSLRAKVSFKTV